LETPAIWLRTLFRKNGLVLSDDQIDLLGRYVDQLLGWNQKVNLISRQDEESVWQNHILHSLSLLFKLNFTEHPTIMDLGTGGGLPGIPLKIVFPDAEFLLVDSTKKKIAAVQDMLKTLDLGGISAVWGRAEELVKQRNLLAHFDYIVARAVAPLSDLISWSRPFLRSSASSQSHPGWKAMVPPPALIALKGGDLEEEINRARRVGKASSIEVVDLVFPGSEEISSTGKKIVVVTF
jgi:16S rRNA (guanine527-N7)-methyltransferase